MADISSLIRLTEKGFECADYPSILAWYQDEYRAIYGQDIYLEADTQDGQWLAIQAKAAWDMGQLMGQLYNSLSPSMASFDALRRNVGINGIAPLDAKNSKTAFSLHVDASTTYPADLVLSDGVHNWILPAFTSAAGQTAVTIMGECEDAGAFTLAQGTTMQIMTPVRGFHGATVANATTANDTGRVAETAAELRARQVESVMLPSQTILGGIVAAIKNTQAGLRCKGYENDTGTTDANGIPAHSIYLVTGGGDRAEIAQIIAIQKTDGVGTKGNISETVTVGGITKTVKWDVATAQPIKVRVEGKKLSGWANTFENSIKTAVAAAINALDIGDDVVASRLYVPAMLVGETGYGTFELQSVTIGTSTDALSSANVVVPINAVTMCTPDDIVVALHD